MNANQKRIEFRSDVNNKKIYSVLNIKQTKVSGVTE